MTNETQKVDVVRISDGFVLRRNEHPVVAENIASAYNRNLYNKGPYCKVSPSIQMEGV